MSLEKHLLAINVYVCDYTAILFVIYFYSSVSDKSFADDVKTSIQTASEFPVVLTQCIIATGSATKQKILPSHAFSKCTTVNSQYSEEEREA